MRNMDSLEVLMVAPVATSAGVYLTMVGGYLDGMRRRGVSARESEVCPRVSILKPLAGLDDELLENLESFTQLDYPDYEILIGIASREDKAYPVARRFVETWGDRARLVITNPDEALNPKVAQLLSLERAATGEVLVIADSNVRVTSQYLRPMLAELSRPKVALTSSVIAGTGEQSLGAALENLQLGALVAPSVVASAHLAGQVMTIGKSMAMWRRALGDIGGFARVANLLSEDHMLGQAFALAGHKVTVSLAPVCNRNVACSLGRTVERHTRWAKLRRSIRARGLRHGAAALASRDRHPRFAGAPVPRLVYRVPGGGRPTNDRRHGYDALTSWHTPALVLGAPRNRSLVRAVLLLVTCLRQPACELAGARLRAGPRFSHRACGTERVVSRPCLGASLNLPCPNLLTRRDEHDDHRTDYRSTHRRT